MRKNILTAIVAGTLVVGGSSVARADIQIECQRQDGTTTFLLTADDNALNGLHRVMERVAPVHEALFDVTCSLHEALSSP